MTSLRILAKALLAASLAWPAAAHEFWLAPNAYALEVGDRLEAQLKNGDNFKGSTYPYIGRFASRFELHDRRGATTITPRDGDNPALSTEVESGGLNVIVYDSAMYTLTYEDWDKFAFFIDSKPNLAWVFAEHEKRGLPREKVKESYYRYPKALIKVGSGAGRDRAHGRLFELVAEINPYSAAAENGVRVQLLYEGRPFPGADIQIFHWPDGAEEAAKDHVTTDATGRAVIPAFDGGPFLINATHMRLPRPEGAAKGMMWESIWASMTYELPR